MAKRQKTKKPESKGRKPKEKASELVFCQRIQEPVSVKEHRGCAYCFGTVKAIEEGDHKEFCDYDPDRDPLQFGFPFK